jgi:hypothetical protein
MTDLFIATAVRTSNPTSEHEVRKQKLKFSSFYIRYHSKRKQLMRERIFNRVIFEVFAVMNIGVVIFQIKTPCKLESRYQHLCLKNQD